MRVTGHGRVQDAGRRVVDVPYALLDGSVDARRRGRRARRRGHHALAAARPARVATASTGLYPNDTWSGREVTWTRLRCIGGRLRVGLHSDPTLFGGASTNVLATVGGRPVARKSIPPQGSVTMRVPLEPVDGRCVVRFTVAPTLVPADVLPGNTDERELGAHFDAFVHEEPA